MTKYKKPEVRRYVSSTGLTCLCGKESGYSMWVAAHWDEKLVYTCECGKKWSLLRGIAVEDNND